ncbi:hypothetical protein DITRI_Ditri04bG0165000 [Diplodiscus trichospermus]
MISPPRRRQRRMPSALSLPEKTITDILSRLPVKSLTRFKSVSKNWAHLTSTPAFVASHLSRFSSEHSLLFSRYNTESGGDYKIWLVTNLTGGPRGQFLDIPLQGPLPRYPRIVGSVDGLVCLDVSPSYASDFVFWNPGTKQYRSLPFPLITSTSNNPIGLVFLGFGLDAFNDDYKLVRIVSFVGNDASPSLMAEVYSWREGIWKEIEGRFDSAVLCGEQDGVFADFSLNWVAVGKQSLADQKVLISFDMKTEFTTIALPPVTQYGNVKVMSYLESLAVAVYPSVLAANGNNTNRFELWLLGDSEDGGIEWSLIYALDEFPNSFVPMAIWRDSVLLFQDMGDPEDMEDDPSLVLFHMDDEEYQTLLVNCDDVCFESFHYVESLVSVNGRSLKW